MAAPVTKGEELELDVDSLAFGGNGVARLDGFVVFVRRGLPGDRVRARVTKVKRSHAEALATEVLVPGPARVEAPCAHYPACGGCRFQDLDYAVQVEAKEAQVREALRRIGGIAEPPLEPILPAVDVFGYRNKMEYSFAPGPDGPELGLHRAGRWDEVLGIERASFTMPWSRGAFLYEIQQNRVARCWVMRDEGRVVGYLCLWEVADEIHITNVAVRPECRRRGLARSLLGGILDDSRQRRIKLVVLEVRPSNTEARTLYESFGFRVVGRRRGYYYDTGEDALVMEADLQTANPGTRA